MKRYRHQVNLTLDYLLGRVDVEKGYFEGGVVDPQFLDELVIWVDQEEQYDFEGDTFVATGVNQIHIGGTARSLFAMGRYLIALSMYASPNPNYHDHLEGLNVVEGKEPCTIITHLPIDAKAETAANQAIQPESKQ